jgi:regulatory protein
VYKKMPSLARYDSATQQRRLMNLLMRRGYNGSVAAALVREAVQAELELEHDE